jgi:DNA-binding response OmpR family regulator
VTHAVLIVDDDPPLLNLLRLIVARDRDLEVVTCRDGDEAIQMLRGRPFDVVLLDLMMPRRSGFDVIEFLSQHRPAQLRVVLVLSASTDELADRLDPSVVHAIVPKPFDMSAIAELVRHIVEAAETSA